MIAAADPIPTMNEAALAGLLLLLGVVGWHRLRKIGGADQRRSKWHLPLLVVFGVASVIIGALSGPAADAETRERTLARSSFLFDRLTSGEA